ncbi:MAG: asparagine synthase-related protein, partial [Bacteroidota bacterium]|nr:asparagine synthase-related protein [Bacteroidota bacterium]
MASIFLILNKSVRGETNGILNNSPEAYDGGFSWEYVDAKSGSCIVSDSRIDYKRELAGKLGVKWKVAEGFSDSKLILFAYLKWREACLSHLYGDFSFVIWDPGKDKVFCARDHFGCRPLYYVDQPGILAVASQITAFKNLPGFRFEIREQYILDSICSIERNDTDSAYKGISRLKPAHYLKQKIGQSSGQHRYWDLKIDESYQGLTLEEASDGLRDRIIEAVRQRSQTSGQIGVELSGGLDSSGIASVLAKLYGQKASINAFTHSISSHGTAQQMYLKNEMEYSTALIEKYNSVRQFKITGENSEGGYKALIGAIHRLYKPINLHYAMNSDLLFEAAGNSGTSIIFSGYGGDEGISNNGSGYFNELISFGQHSKLRENIKSIVFRRGGSYYKRLIKLYINYYAPWALSLHEKDWRKVRYRSFALQKSLARKYRMKRRFFYKTPVPGKPDVRAIQYFRIMYPNIPERIEETSLLAQQHGIEYRYPFLDVKLLEFFYSLPSVYKYKDGTGRFLFRKAMEDILPEKIRTRTDKGGNTIPNVFARVLKDEKIFREIIEEGRVKNQYHYVDYDKLNEMLDTFKNMEKLKRRDYGLRAFQSPMSVL